MCKGETNDSENIWYKKCKIYIKYIFLYKMLKI